MLEECYGVARHRDHRRSPFLQKRYSKQPSLYPPFSMPEKEQIISIAATFTAEPIEESIKFWMREMGIAARVQFSPFNQIFSQLLDDSSLLSTNSHGTRLLLIRFEDWQADRNENWVVCLDHFYRDIEQSAQDMVRAVKSG